MSLLNHIVRETGMMPSEVRGLLPTMQRRYKVFEIPKKSGGTRSIAQPAREVKEVQYAVMSGLLRRLPIHPQAMAYRDGIGLVENAAVHAGRNAILKLDFEGFFNSIRQSDFELYLANSLKNLSVEDISLAALACFWKPSRRAVPVLSVGAPSSPMISNAMLFDLDERLLGIATAHGAKYTRYADDLTFSHPSAGELWAMYPEIRAEIQSNRCPRLRINAQKTKVFSPRTRRSVTGIVIANSGEVSLGRDRKRGIEAASHRFLLGEMEMEKVRELAGWLAFASQVEPDFLRRMEQKHNLPVVRLVREAISKHDRLNKAA